NNFALVHPFSLYSKLSAYVFSPLFFHDTAPTDIYTLSLHDALPISLGDRLVVEAPRSRHRHLGREPVGHFVFLLADARGGGDGRDRKSTRLTPVTWPSRMPSSA